MLLYISHCLSVSHSLDVCPDACACLCAFICLCVSVSVNAYMCVCSMQTLLSTSFGSTRRPAKLRTHSLVSTSTCLIFV